VFNIVVCEGRPVGVLRLEKDGDGTYEISILIAAEYHNRKIGGNALALARSVVPDALIRAEIHPDNEASIRMFERAGYRRVAGCWASSPELTCQ
jgi:RimJ/RimL family protein N-acetyltransferase